MPDFYHPFREDSSLLTVLDASEFISQNRTVPTFEDRGPYVGYTILLILLMYTMMTGMAMVESGLCAMKNECNHLLRNMSSICFSGLSFWLVGYGLAHGEGNYATGFNGWGEWAYQPDWMTTTGAEQGVYFLYQACLFALETSILSGGMAERVCQKSFMLIAVLNVLVYSFPTYWVWAPQGFLRQMGVVDLVGIGPVHIVGGFSGLAATLFLGPRTGREMGGALALLGHPGNFSYGMFIVMWGYLAMNAISTKRPDGTRIQFSSKGSLATLISSFGAGLSGLIQNYLFYGSVRVDYVKIFNCLMGSFVAIGAVAFLTSPIECFCIGLVAGILIFQSEYQLDMITSYDDPCCTFLVHGLCGVWSYVAVGLFADADNISPQGKVESLNEYDGLFRGGLHLIGVQALGALVLSTWSLISTYILLKLVNYILPVRVDVATEMVGSDYIQNGIDLKENKSKKYVEILEKIDPSITRPAVKPSFHLDHFYNVWKKENEGQRDEFDDDDQL